MSEPRKGEDRVSPKRSPDPVRRLKAEDLLPHEMPPATSEPPVQELSVKGLLSFGEQTSFTFGRLNILVGPNGSGKSNLIDCVRVLRYPNDLCVLLVDSEGPVRHGQSVWDFVAQRPGDQWVKPDGAQEIHLYLMVQFVEAWLLTDQDALANFFKQGFTAASLPTTNLENRTKREIERALETATQNSGRGVYRHGQAHEIMEFVRPARVKTLKHGKRLFETLATMIKS